MIPALKNLTEKVDNGSYTNNSGTMQMLTRTMGGTQTQLQIGKGDNRIGQAFRENSTDKVSFKVCIVGLKMIGEIGKQVEEGSAPGSGNRTRTLLTLLSYGT